MSPAAAIASTSTVVRRRARRSLGAHNLVLVADAATKVSGLGTIVILAHLLPTAELARFGVALAVATVLTSLLDAGASTVVARDGSGDQGRLGRIVLGSALGRVPLVVAVAAAT